MARWIDVELGIADIEVNPALQMRAIEPPADEYHEILAKDKGVWPFPKLRVIKFGNRHLLVEGFTRLRAAEKAGLMTVPVETRPGTWMDAVVEACGSNAEHGYRRTASDKRRAVVRAYEEGVTGKTELAKLCRVSRATVYTVLDEMEKRSDTGKAKTKPGPKSVPPVSERSDPCPVCNSRAWEATDGGYICGVCQHIDGEVAGSDPEEAEERVDRSTQIETGIDADLKELKANFGRLVRSLKKCGIDAERPLNSINKLISQALKVSV